MAVIERRPLAANESYIQPGRDRFEGNEPVGSVRGLVYASHAGTLYLEESDDDGDTWSTTATVSVAAKTTTPLPWTALTKQQYRFRYVNGATKQTKFRLVQQTRGMELADVQLTGRKGAVEDGDYGVTLNVAASGYTTVTVTPPAGELWRLKVLRVNFPAVTGASSGTHNCELRVGTNNTNYSVIYAKSNYGSAISVLRNIPASADSDKSPSADTDWIRNINNVICTNAKPLFLIYFNDTNATQSGNLTLNISREVEYVVS